MSSFGLSEYFAEKYADLHSSRSVKLAGSIVSKYAQSLVDDSMGVEISAEDALGLKNKFIRSFENATKDNVYLGDMWKMLKASAMNNQTTFYKDLNYIIDGLSDSIHATNLKGCIEVCADTIHALRELEKEITFVPTSKFTSKEVDFINKQIELLISKLDHSMKYTFRDSYTFGKGTIDVSDRAGKFFGNSPDGDATSIRLTPGKYDGNHNPSQDLSKPTEKTKLLNKLNSQEDEEFAALISDLNVDGVLVPNKSDVVAKFAKIRTEGAIETTNWMDELLRSCQRVVKKQFVNMSKEDFKERSDSLRKSVLVKMDKFARDRSIALRELARNCFESFKLANSKNKPGEALSDNEIWASVAAHLETVTWNRQEVLSTIKAVKK